MFGRKIFLSFLVVIVVLFSRSALAAEWSGETEISTRLNYNDNVYLAVNNEQEATALIFSPSYKLSRAQADQSFSALADINLTRYRNEPVLDRDEGQAQLDWTKLTERSRFNINGVYSQYSSLNQMLDVSGLTDQPVDVITKSASPSWGYQLTETWGINLGYMYSDVKYDEPGIEGFVDPVKLINFVNYQTDRFNFSIIKSLNEKDQLHFTVSNTKYKGESNGFQLVDILLGYYVARERLLDYDYQVYQLGYSHQFSELQSISLSYGRNRQDVNNQTRAHYFDPVGTEVLVDPWETFESSQRGNVYNINYAYENELSRIEFTAGQDRTSESTGGLVERTFLEFHYRHKLTELLTFGIVADAEDRKDDINTSVVSSNDRKRYSVTPSIEYQISRSWYVSGRYRFLKRDIDSAPDAAESNAIYLSMIWRDKNIF